MNDSSKVSFGKPKSTGAIFVAPAGSTLPTNATDALDSAFKCLGYIHEDGLVNNISTDTEEVKAWGSDTVLMGQTAFSETFTFSPIEINAETLKFYYGEDNVTVSGDNITVKQNSKELPEIVAVFELVLTGGRIKRVVVPFGRIVDRSGDITYTDGDPVAYPVVLWARPDGDGNTHTEYIAVVSSS